MNHLLEFANLHPNTWRAEEALQSAVLDAQRSGLSARRAVDLVMRLIEAGKAIANGGSGCEALESARAIVLHEVAGGNITTARAQSVLQQIDAIQSLLDE
jgi:hypothetical protein